MKIYQTEILDGLEQTLTSSNTIAYCSQAESYTPSEHDIKIAKALDNGNSDQIDLFYMRSILVSTGWNKNDDVFDPQELWAARRTPEDKPFNFMHNEKDIIGHITGNTIVDFNGDEINDDLQETPSEFNILTTSVIYTAWSDKEQKERMDKIVSEIEQGKWFVSMECLFPDFDYALIGEDGQSRVIKRAEASAFLTKHLRAYGGTGKYENFKVGRLLRNLAFSGKGLVSKPANPRSIILDGNEFFDESKASALDVSLIKENNMSDVLNQQMADLQKDLAEAKAANNALKSELDSAKSAETQAAIDELNEELAAAYAQVAELTEAMKHGKEEMKKKEEEMEAMKKDMAEKDMYIKDVKKKEAMMKRKASLLEIGVKEETAASTVEDFADASDETFDRVVATLKKAIPEAKASSFLANEEVEETVAANEESKLDEELDSSGASEADLDAVDEPESAIAEIAVEDEVEVLRAAASEWLGSVLKSKK
jgi:hypothetical protein